MAGDPIGQKAVKNAGPSTFPGPDGAYSPGPDGPGPGADAGVPGRKADPPHRLRRQGAIGVGLAFAIIAAWLLVHVYSVFFYVFTPSSWLTAPILMALACWLYVGLFIVAHDAMHGSLAPGNAWLNRRLGQLCLAIYAGFDFDTLNRKHHLHHQHAGSADDPDYDERPPHGFVSWYAKFLMAYFSWRQLLFMAVLANVYMRLFGAEVANLAAFWAIPAFVSSIQLFLFGTYLPHRPGADAFADRHRARSLAYGWWLSLLSCFHFGYHHEHHDRPWLPWWRLPEARR